MTMKNEFKLNPWAEEFVPSSRRHLSATAAEFVPSSHRRLSAAAPEFIPRSHVHCQPNTVWSRQFTQAQRSRAQPESSHAGSESSDKDAKAEIMRAIYVGDIIVTLGSISEEDLQREFSNCGVVTRGDVARPQWRGGCCTGVVERPRNFGERVVGSDNFYYERENRRGEIKECWVWRKKEVVNGENGE